METLNKGNWPLEKKILRSFFRISNRNNNHFLIFFVAFLPLRHKGFQSTKHQNIVKVLIVSPQNISYGWTIFLYDLTSNIINILFNHNSKVGGNS